MTSKKSKSSKKRTTVRISGPGVIYADPSEIVTSAGGKKQLKSLRKLKKESPGHLKLKSA